MRLETTRLVLREWEESDIPDLIEGIGDIEVSKWMAVVPHPYTQKDAENWIAICASQAEKGDERGTYSFAIELKSERKVIGGVSLDGVNRHHGIAGGGIWTSARYHGHGYGTEAFGKRIEFAFRELGLRRLESGFFAGNYASLKMQEKFGYRIEGLRRKGFRCLADRQLKDEYITALLVEEWIEIPL